jgi:hypothetical protein
MASRQVRAVGRFAHAALDSGEARVIAVFERSAYVEAPAGIACIGAVGNGPLNAVSDFLPSDITVGDTVAIDLRGARIWQPRCPPQWNPILATDGLARLRLAARGRLPSTGLGYLLDPGSEQPTSVKALARWIADPGASLDEGAALIGLGPGLTPSGDDLIGGALCALHAARWNELATRLAKWALPLAREATSRISYAHLACAAEGECGEAVNDAIVALLSGQSPDLARINAIGHTSGWDALAGIALTLKLLSESNFEKLDSDTDSDTNRFVT